MSFFEIVLEKQITESNSDFWFEIIKQLISGTAIGITLALIGYYIWKRQNAYSKKFDAYINLISSLSEIHRLAFNSIVLDSVNFFNMPKLQDFYSNNQNFMYDFQKNKILFISYFGSEHLDKIEYFINIEKNIADVQITIKNNSGSYTQKFPPEERTPEIISEHKQQVIDKMAKYLNDLKSVSKSFKKHIL